MSRENSRAASRLASLAINGELTRFGASVLRILSSPRKLGYLDDASSFYKACPLSKKQRLMTSKYSRNLRKRPTKAQTFTEGSLQGIGFRTLQRQFIEYNILEVTIRAVPFRLVKKISYGQVPPQSLTPYRFLHHF